MWQSEAQESHGGDHDARNDEVYGVEQSPAADQDGERNVHVGLRTAGVVLHILDPGHACNTHTQPDPRVVVSNLRNLVEIL